jgi:hypothetical protein
VFGATGMPILQFEFDRIGLFQSCEVPLRGSAADANDDGYFRGGQARVACGKRVVDEF